MEPPSFGPPASKILSRLISTGYGPNIFSPAAGHPPATAAQLRELDDNTAPVLLGVGAGLLITSITLLIARVWSRLRPVMKLNADDWTVLCAEVLAITNYIVLSASVYFGLGRRSLFVSYESQRTATLLLFVSQLIWYASITLVKISVALLLLRIKSQSLHARRWNLFLYITMLILVLAFVVQTFFTFLQCRPFSVYWDPALYKKSKVQCIPRSVINGNIVAFSAIQIGIDLMLSFTPITFIRKLHRPRREKIFICVLMALGLFTSFAAIIRTLALQNFYTTPDLFRTNVSITLWASVEQQLALIAATIPTLKAVLERGLVRIGLLFYNEKSETRVRQRMVQLGFLGEDEKLQKWEGDGQNSERVASPGSEKVFKEVREQVDDSMFDVKGGRDDEKVAIGLAK